MDLRGTAAHREHLFGMICRILVILLFLGIHFLPIAWGAEAHSPLGVAVLLDESDSMEENDPGRVRIKAASLFSRLVGTEGEVSVLGFSGTTRELPLEETGLPRSASRVRYPSKTAARAGQYSNIERAVRHARDALLQQDFAAGKPRRGILIVTDGQVDLGNSKADRISRESLRGPVAADLIEKGIVIYAIAFSTLADRELLEYLARMTGGFCLSANHIGDLPEFFLRIYEELAEAQSIPVNEGQALVDSAVREATFLIPRPPAARQTYLVRPDGSRISREIHGDGTLWEVLPGYDLVRISGPMEGLWSVEPTPERTVPRLLVQSDLAIRLREVPVIMVAGQGSVVSLDLAGSGSGEGLGVRAVLSGQREQVWAMQPGEGGILSARIVPPSETGSFDLELLAEGKGFQRRLVRRVAVVPRWFQVQMDRDTVPPGEMVRIIAMLDGKNSWLPAAMRFEASVAGPDGVEKHLPMQTRDNGRTYTAALDGLKRAGNYRITVLGRVLSAGKAAGQAQVGPLDLAVQESIASPPLLALPPLGAAMDGTAGTGSSKTLQAMQTGADEKDEASLAKGRTDIFFWMQGGILALLGLLAVFLAILIARRPMGSPGRQRVFTQPALSAKAPTSNKPAEAATDGRNDVREPEEHPQFEAPPLVFVPEVLVEVAVAPGNDPAGDEARNPTGDQDEEEKEAGIGLTEEEADILQGLMREAKPGIDAQEEEECAKQGKPTKQTDKVNTEIPTGASPEAMGSLFAEPGSTTETAEELPNMGTLASSRAPNAGDSEEQLLAELAQMEVPVPDIPEELDERSDQDVIDDILRQIEDRRE